MYLRKPSLILKIMLESKWKIVTISSAGECAEKLSLSQIASGNVKWYSHPGRQFGSFLKNYIHLPDVPSFSLLNIPEKNETCPRENLYVIVHSNFW